MLSDVAKVFPHPFTKSPLSVTNVLFETYDAGDAICDIVGFAVTLSDGIVVTSSNWTDDRPGVV